MTTRLAVMVLCLALLASACGGSDNAGASASADELPDIELNRLEGGIFDVTATGEARVLNLWATWCAPCRAELPAFDSVAGRLNEIDGAPRIIGVNVGDTGDDAAALVEELGLSFDQVLDPRAQIQRALRITGMPSTILVDRSGAVLDVHNGELTERELEELLDEFFGVDLVG